MKKVRAKFKLNSKQEFAHYEDGAVNVNLEFTAVAAECEENKDWSKWTPSGELKMTVTNPGAVEMFDVGKEYFLNIVPAD